MIHEDPSLNCQWKQFENPGYLIIDVPNDLLSGLKTKVNNILENNFDSPKLNNKLAGIIEHEHRIKIEKVFADFVCYSCILYHQKHISSFEKQIFEYPKFSEVWVNFQKKTEYNPIHYHSGTFSFVVWINIPYNVEDEWKIPSSVNSIKSTVGTFQFQYVNAVGKLQTETLDVDKSWEGKMIVFPASIHHCVYPFYTSDEYRISIAGNVTI
jgi:hypothetical protein